MFVLLIIIVSFVFFIYPDIIIYNDYLKNKKEIIKLLCLLPSILGLIIAISFLDGVEDNYSGKIFFYILMLIALPKTIFVFLYKFLKKIPKKIAIIISIMFFVFSAFSFFVESYRLQEREYQLEFENLPKEFDGYKIVEFSDLHLGSFRDSVFMRKVVDKINSKNPDLLVFCGDMVNKRSIEAEKFLSTLQLLKAKDGKFSVLGNHDYAIYGRQNINERRYSVRHLIEFQNDLGFDVLQNSFRIIEKDSAKIAIVGTHNNGDKSKPKLGDIKKSYQNLNDSIFSIVLTHDPSYWKMAILDSCNANLTLSGHTHAGQVSIFGFKPLCIFKSENDGLYNENNRYLIVSRGVGAGIPFRFGSRPSIEVITLKKKK